MSGIARNQKDGRTDKVREQATSQQEIDSKDLEELKRQFEDMPN